MNALSLFPPSRADALDRLHRFLPRAGTHYTARRNYDLGPKCHTDVSTLSPYIRTRMLPETEVLRSVLGRFSLSSSEKFLQEVYWRSYWKGWLELRPAIWIRYQEQLKRDLNDVQTQSGLKSEWRAACSGDTGIACFDHWAQELVETGYLHNHARMWFASIWIYTLRLPWALGADFFLRHLIDGDPASNTLSWRWICGLQTQGKTYLARASNIAKYTDGRFDPTHGLATSAPPLSWIPHPSIQPLPKTTTPIKNARTGVLLHAEDLSPGFVFSILDTDTPTFVLRAEAQLSPLHVAPHVQAFHDGAIADMLQRYSLQPDGTSGEVSDIVEWMQRNKIAQLVTPYAPVGPTATLLDRIDTEIDVPMHRIRRPFDSLTWPHATHGFFRFKNNLSAFSEALANPSIV